jgi:hypothetical protein
MDYSENQIKAQVKTRKGCKEEKRRCRCFNFPGGDALSQFSLSSLNMHTQGHVLLDHNLLKTLTLDIFG